MFLFYWALQDPKLGRIKTNFRLLGVEGELILLMESSGEKKCTYQIKDGRGHHQNKVTLLRLQR